MEKVIYIAELDADIDDIIAVEYLHKQNVLDTLVLDPIPKDAEGRKRLEILRKKGIKVSDTIPEGAKIIFIGGGLTAVAKYISNHSGIETLVMNGGFAGSNIVPFKNQLAKFRNKTFIRTFNFNIDVKSTDIVLRSSVEQIRNIILVGKNVCHSDRNTKLGLWKNGIARKILDEYHVKDDKKQHDMLACHEGLALTSLIDEEPICVYQTVYPRTENGLEGNMTKWGSANKQDGTPYRAVQSAVGFRGEK